MSSILTSRERKALDEAAVSFANRKYELHNKRIRPDGESIFEWLSSKKNAKAFKEARKTMDLIGTNNG